MENLDQLAIVDRVPPDAFKLDRSVSERGSRIAQLVTRSKLRSNAAKELWNSDGFGDEVVGAARQRSSAVRLSRDDDAYIAPFALAAQSIEQRPIALHDFVIDNDDVGNYAFEVGEQ
jgi:hypothetical protein